MLFSKDFEFDRQTLLKHLQRFLVFLEVRRNESATIIALGCVGMVFLKEFEFDCETLLVHLQHKFGKNESDLMIALGCVGMVFSKEFESDRQTLLLLSSSLPLEIINISTSCSVALSLGSSLNILFITSLISFVRDFDSKLYGSSILRVRFVSQRRLRQR
jgi:hypothetical protein